MNLYRFMVGTDSINGDNIFSILASNAKEASSNILEQVMITKPKWLSITLVYTDDKTIKNEDNYEGNITIQFR